MSDEQLYRILDSARFAPSGGNRQGWRVIVVRDQAKRRELVDQSMPIGKPVKQLTHSSASRSRASQHSTASTLPHSEGDAVQLTRIYVLDRDGHVIYNPGIGPFGYNPDHLGNETKKYLES